MPEFRRAVSVAAALFALVAPAVAAQNPDDDGAKDGLFVTVTNPIESSGFLGIRDQINAALSNTDRPVSRIVFDFNPNGRDAATSEYGACYDLAEYIASLNKVSTVAFVRGRATRHTVLPVLACRELVMSSAASLGDVFPEGQRPDPAKRDYYLKLAGPAYAGLALKMLDANTEVWKGRRDGGDVFYDGRQADAARTSGVTGGQAVPALASGSGSLLNAKQLREFGMCRRLLESRQQVAEAYNLTPTSLREDPFQGRQPNPWRIDVRGPVNGALVETLQRRIGRAVNLGADLIFLQLECAGGDAESARKLADYLRNLRTDDGASPVRTVAYIPGDAPDVSAFLAFGCSEMALAPNAVIGDFSGFLKPGPNKPARSANAIAASLAEVAQEQGYSPLLARAMLESDLVIVRAVSVKGNVIERRLMSKDEFDAANQGEAQWRELGLVKRGTGPQPLTAVLAKDLGLARVVLDNSRDFNELYRKYRLDPAKVREAGPDWLDGMLEFFRKPGVAAILLLLGIGGLILELKMPGFGVPGIISALCFVLFFWSQSQVSGQIIWLALLLFLLGLVLIVIEIFLLPGLGVTGISGLVLVLLGLALATLQKMPSTSQEWAGLGLTMTQFSFSVLGAGLGSILVAKFLPNIPYVNRLILRSPVERGADELALPPLPGVETPTALLGLIGTAATTLRPAGMAQIGDAYVDVLSDGGYIQAGARVQVILVEGNRVVVKEVL